MTVADLIAELKKHPADMPVEMDYDGYIQDVTGVEADPPWVDMRGRQRPAAITIVGY